MSSKILVIAAHSDDEALGCGATLSKHAKNGDVIEAVFMTNGVSARSAQENIESRVSASHRAAEIMGIQNITQLDFPDNELDSVSLLSIVKPLEKVIAKFQPDIIYTHHCADLNIDHARTHQAVMTACRPMPLFTIKKILAFEVMSSTEWQSYGGCPFVPNYYVDVSDFVDQKINALHCYREEMRTAPHSRSLEHVYSLMRHRGYSIGVDAAEAFMLIRAIA